MGKNKKKRKHSLFHAAKAGVNGLVDASYHNDGGGSACSLEDAAEGGIMAAAGDDDDDNERDEVTISESALSVTLQTLQRLVERPQLFHSKRFKDLRRTLHPLVMEQLPSYDKKGIDYRQKVTHALQYRHWSDALAALQACQDFRQVPKQGTIQRWVRDCCCSSASTEEVNDNAASAAAGTVVQMQLLQAILRLSDLSSSSSESGNSGSNQNRHDASQMLAEQLATKPSIKDEFKVVEAWKWWSEDEEEGDNNNNNLKGNERPPTEPRTIEIQSKVLYRENGADRTPPNHYDLLLHTTEPNSVAWDTHASSAPSAVLITAHSVPFLPEPSRVLSHVFSPNECRRLLDIMTTLKYRPDHPIALDHPTGIDSCEWMVDSSISDVLLERVKPHLPSILSLSGSSSGNNKKKRVRLHSINARWRGFRYSQEGVYRPHLDGSWPRSFIDEQTGQYSCSCPTTKSNNNTNNGGSNGDTIKSFLTFLIYLNDDFEGGETRFYLPDGTARGIVPKQGCVTVFPQGNLASLIHEGSRVTKGTKYVVRTDVLYQPIQEEEEENAASMMDDDDCAGSM